MEADRKGWSSDVFDRLRNQPEGGVQSALFRARLSARYTPLLKIHLASIALSLGALAACHKAPPPKVITPDVFRVKFETTQGDFTVEAVKAWAPHGVDRFYELLRMHYFDQSRFFRVLPGFIAQFGVHRDFKVQDVWRTLFIVDDPRVQSNTRGTLAFAKSGPDTRATEIFINLADNQSLDDDNFVPFARIVDGIDVIDKFYSGYGDVRPKGANIDPGRVEEEANEYLVPRFPKLDYIKRTTILP